MTMLNSNLYFNHFSALYFNEVLSMVNVKGLQFALQLFLCISVRMLWTWKPRGIQQLKRNQQQKVGACKVSTCLITDLAEWVWLVQAHFCFSRSKYKMLLAFWVFSLDVITLSICRAAVFHDILSVVHCIGLLTCALLLAIPIEMTAICEKRSKCCF